MAGDWAGEGDCVFMDRVDGVLDGVLVVGGSGAEWSVAVLAVEMVEQ